MRFYRPAIFPTAWVLPPALQLTIRTHNTYYTAYIPHLGTCATVPVRALLGIRSFYISRACALLFIFPGFNNGLRLIPLRRMPLHYLRTENAAPRFTACDVTVPLTMPDVKAVRSRQPLPVTLTYLVLSAAEPWLQSRGSRMLL